jgi:hypothetical protein
VKIGNVIGGIFLCLVVGVASALKLLHRDSEVRRLIDIEHAWGRVKGDESELLHRRKRNLVLGYTLFLLISVTMLVYFCVELLRMVGPIK